MPDCNINSIEKTINKLIAKHLLLRTTINKDMSLIVYENFSYKLFNSIISNEQEMDKIIIEELKANIYNNLLWSACYYVNLRKIKFYFNHIITDQSSVNLFTQQFYSIFNQEYQIKECDTDYLTFIKFINKNSKIDNLIKIANLGFLDVSSDIFFENKYNDNLKYFKFDTHYSENDDNIAYANFILSKLLCLSQHKKLVSGSTIINLREFNQFSITNVFGDVHSTIPVICYKENTFQEFRNNYDYILDIYKSGDNLNNTIYHNYPHIPEELKKFELYLDSNLKFSCNYLGAIKQQDINIKVEGLVAQQIELENFSTAKLYISFFKCGDSLIFIPITKGLIDLKAIKKLGGEYYV